ncbi:MAG: hypothetical protein AAFR23_03795 [Pseudomonadota bacterium]
MSAFQPVLRSVCLLLVSGLLVGFASTSTEAGWLTRMVREAGEAGGDAARRATGDLDALSTAAARLPRKANETVLAAKPSSAGHWTFRNADGETFTASTAAEVGRGFDILAPASRRRNISIVVSDRVLFEDRAALALLPERARLVVTSRAGLLPVERLTSQSADDIALRVRVRPNLAMPVTTRAHFTEAMYLLTRRRTVTETVVLSLTNTTPKTVTPSNPTDALAPKISEVRAADLSSAIASLKRKTVIVVGDVDGPSLTYRTPSGGSDTIDLTRVRQTAADNDVSLILLNSSAARQPGQRNWLWQRAAVDRLDAAVRQQTFADMLNTLGGPDGRLVLAVTETSAGRTVLRAEPADAGVLSGEGGGIIGDVVTNILSETAGKVVTSAIELDVPDRDRQRELSLRIVPGVPSIYQISYLVSLVLGVVGLAFARAWWRRVWPPEQRAEYGNLLGFFLARLVRWSLFVIVWLPLVGIPAGVSAIAMQAFGLIMLPFRMLGWVVGLFRRDPADARPS